MPVPHGFDTASLHQVRIIPESAFAAGILRCRSFYAVSFTQRSHDDIFADEWLLTKLELSISNEEEEEEEERRTATKQKKEAQQSLPEKDVECDFDTEAH
jgi:hypothetical protein